MGCILRCRIANVLLVEVLPDHVRLALATPEIPSDILDQLVLAVGAPSSHGIGWQSSSAGRTRGETVRIPRFLNGKTHF
jgi:hypothetical protein